LKSLFSIYINSRILKKLINRILIIEALSFLIIAALTFFILYPLLEARAIETASDVNSQMADKIDTTIQSLTTASQYMISSRELRSALNDFDTANIERNRKIVCLALNRLAESQPNIRGIFLEADSGVRFDSVTNLRQTYFLLLEDPWYQEIKTNVYSQGYSLLFGDEQGSVRKTLVYARNCYIGPQSYALAIYYDAGTLLSELQRLSDNSFSGYLIIDRYGKALFKNGDITLSAADTVISGHYSKTAYGIYFTDMVQTNMWNMVSFAKKSFISGTFSGYLWATFALFVLLSVLTVLLITPAIYHTIKPVGTLSEAMWRAAEGDLSSIPEFKTNDEIGDLSVVFNKMAFSLQEYIRRQIEHEQKEQKMKYSLLISQVDPHFIYNTMNIINSLARKNQTDDIVMINNALITILQDRLRVNTIEVFDTVRQELEILKQYLLIQNRRYENHAKIAWEINEEILERQIPKNIIQPLVENALFHGLIDEETGDITGEIRIIIVEDNDVLRIIVQDDGRGIEAGKVKEILSDEQPGKKSRGRHMGLRSIRERLAYLYGQKDCMQIDCEERTTVTLNLPLDSGNN
jgi:sensor histidine kinase YesM